MWDRRPTCCSCATRTTMTKRIRAESGAHWLWNGGPARITEPVFNWGPDGWMYLTHGVFYPFQSKDSRGEVRPAWR